MAEKEKKISDSCKNECSSCSECGDTSACLAEELDLFKEKE